MLLKQLTKDAEAWLQSQGYTKSTIYHKYESLVEPAGCKRA